MSKSISLPQELLEEIVSVTWFLPLSVEERVSLMTTLPLVNSTWRAAYILVSSKDVHIPCESYLRRHAAWNYRDGEPRIPISKNICRSVTFAIHSSVPLRHLDLKHPMTNAITYILNCNLLHYPNLRKVAIHYHNISLDDIFKNMRFFALPSHISVLQIAQTFSPDLTPSAVSELRDQRLSKFALWEMSGIKHLILEGVGSDYIADMLTMCLNIKTLELGLAPKSDVVVYLPTSVERLILRAPMDVKLSLFNVPQLNLYSRDCRSTNLHVIADAVLLDFGSLFLDKLPQGAQLATSCH